MSSLSQAHFGSTTSAPTTCVCEDRGTKENAQKKKDDDTFSVRRVSQNTTISSIPPSLADVLPSLTHRAKRPPFRSPSSIRALQLSDRELGSPQHFKHHPNRRKWSLAALRHSELSDDDDHDDPEAYLTQDGDSPILQHMMSHKRQERQRRRQGAVGYRSVSNSTTGTLQLQAPLVLLHITILPSTISYSRATLEKVVPTHIIQDLDLLRDKLNDNVFARGILVPHPHEEYNVLEERLLEALDLHDTRTTPCEHFLGQENDSFLYDGSAAEVPDNNDDLPLSSPTMQAICDYAHDETQSIKISASDRCDISAAPIGSTARDVCSTDKRWEISFYAANGLMRAGAWSAAWKEMERVDVEIAPWIPQEVKRALEEETEAEARRQEGSELARLQHQLQESSHRMLALEDDLVRLHDELEATKARSSCSRRDSTGSFNERANATTKNSNIHTNAAIPLEQSMRDTRDVPLDRLLIRYLSLMAQDKRNIALLMLSLFIAILALSFAKSSSVSPLHRTATIETASAPAISHTTSLAAPSSAIASDMLSTGTSLLSDASNAIGTKPTVIPAQRRWL